MVVLLVGWMVSKMVDPMDKKKAELKAGSKASLMVEKLDEYWVARKDVMKAVWKVDSLVEYSVEYLVEYLVHLMVEWMVDWMVEYSVDRMDSKMVDPSEKKKAEPKAGLKVS